MVLALEEKMKKSFFLIVFGFLTFTKIHAHPPVDVAFTTGYLWKGDTNFNRIYGRGIHDVITIDACFWWWQCTGIGVKGGYWSADGRDDFTGERLNMHEIPFIFYVRGRVGDRLQGYASLGAGFIANEERSDLEIEVRDRLAGAFEAEIGSSYYFCKHVFATAAFHYIYSRYRLPGTVVNADFGGYGLRAGLGVWW